MLLPKASPNIPGLAAEDQDLAAQAFWEAWSHPWPGQVALSRPVYPSLDVESARRELAEEIRFLVDLANVRSGDGARLTVQDYLDSGAFHTGSVDNVVASLTADPALGCATELICQVGHIGPGPREHLPRAGAPRHPGRPSPGLAPPPGLTERAGVQPAVFGTTLNG